jgi:hypothetical protein
MEANLWVVPVEVNEKQTQGTLSLQDVFAARFSNSYVAIADSMFPKVWIFAFGYECR